MSIALVIIALYLYAGLSHWTLVRAKDPNGAGRYRVATVLLWPTFMPIGLNVWRRQRKADAAENAAIRGAKRGAK